MSVVTGDPDPHLCAAEGRHGSLCFPPDSETSLPKKSRDRVGRVGSGTGETLLYTPREETECREGVESWEGGSGTRGRDFGEEGMGGTSRGLSFTLPPTPPDGRVVGESHQDTRRVPTPVETV